MAPKRRRDETDDEEEPEGEDLFDERFVRGAGIVLDDDEEGPEVPDSADFIDDSSLSEVSEGGRREVDALIDARDDAVEQVRQHRRQPSVSSGASASSSGSSDSSNGENEDENAAPAQSDGPIAPLAEISASWAMPVGPLTEWLAQDAPRRGVVSQLYHFFNGFSVGDVYVYHEAAHALAGRNGQSLHVEYWHLFEVYNSVFCVWLTDAPIPMLDLMHEAVEHFVFSLYPRYRRVHAHLFARVRGMPLVDPIREFRQVQISVLVQVEGVVVRRSPVYPKLQAVKFDCVRCGFIIGPIMQRGDRELRVGQCPSCQSKGPFRVNMALTQYSNYQTVLLQESPGKVPPGRLPRNVEAILTDDLIDLVRPGDEVLVTGVYRTNFDPAINARQGFPVLSTVLHANNIETPQTHRFGSSALREQEREVIVRLSKHPNIRQKLIRSIAPSIHGREDIKLGVLLTLLGGVPKSVGSDHSHNLRGDINVLLLGDPGCAKSQLLKFIEKTAERAVFTTGRGSTAVGLTASVHKDPVSGDFTLEGGALVIADRGVCLIDEFDKMSDQDRTSIHEAMEQQTISVARGGIVATLSARCSVVAAANPLGGRYDPSQSFDANVNLTPPILSRFDLLFVLRDDVDPAADRRLATFVCASHRRSHPGGEGERKNEGEAHESAPSGDDDPSTDLPLRQELLRQYVGYARRHCVPRMSRINPNTIPQLYTELRQESNKGGVPITVRHMESIIRLSEAHAKMYLRDFVTNDDVSAAIALFLKCFLGTQRYSVRMAMETKFQAFLDRGVEPLSLLLHRLRVMFRRRRAVEQHITGRLPSTVVIECSAIDDVAAEVNVSRETVALLYESPEFLREFSVQLDTGGRPQKVIRQFD